jgi:hypothetical protein
MGSFLIVREKCLRVKEKWPIALTPIGCVCYRRGSCDGSPVVYPPSPQQYAVRRIGVVVVLQRD